MEYLIIGIVVALNIIFIKMKFDRNRTEDAIFDTALLITITMIFSGTYSALVVGTIASMFISIFLFTSPPKWFSGSNGVYRKFLEKTKKKKYRDL